MATGYHARSLQKGENNGVLEGGGGEGGLVGGCCCIGERGLVWREVLAVVHGTERLQVWLPLLCHHHPFH